MAKKIILQQQKDNNKVKKPIVNKEIRIDGDTGKFAAELSPRVKPKVKGK